MPARRASGAVHGTAPFSVQSTLNTDWSHVKRRRSSRTCARTCAPCRRGRGTGAARRRRRARRVCAAISSPRVRTPTARPLRTMTLSTGALHSSRPPFAERRATSASVRRPAPPSGTGQPMSCPRLHRIHPKNPLNTSPGARSACRAEPANSRRASFGAELLGDEPLHGEQGETREADRPLAPGARARASRSHAAAGSA